MLETFGRYQLLDLIGRGGMAEVFRARLEAPAGAEKVLVIKRILPNYSSDPEFIRLFVNEAKIALSLTHGAITSVFEFGEVDEQYFLAMEYIHGRNLHEVLARCRETATAVPPPAALYIGSEVAKGLAYAHAYTAPDGTRKEIVHLDVSPENVLLSYDGAVKLTDFGISKARATSSLESGIVRGKLAYLAPEQLTGGAVDGRTDVFALGCVVYEMLTGKLAVEAETPETALALIEQGLIPRPSALRPELANLDELVMKALSARPDDRYQKASDLQVAIAQAQFSGSPGYGSIDLGEWMRDVFAWELAEMLGENRGDLKDRLLFQLAKAKVKVDPGAQTRELLNLHTVEVEIPKPPPALPDPPARPPLAVIAGSAVAAIVVVVSAVALLAGGPGGEGAPDAGSPAATGPITKLKADAGPGGSGLLSFNSWPTSTVYVDGERAGSTPMLRVEVPAGEHEIQFVSADSGLRKKIEVKVASGSERSIAVQLR